MNYCINCKYLIKGNEWQENNDPDTWKCGVAPLTDPLTGERKDYHCRSWRIGSDWEVCRKYEAKE